MPISTENQQQAAALAYLEARIGKLEAQIRELLAAPKAPQPPTEEILTRCHSINPATGQTETVDLPLGAEAVRGMLPATGSTPGRTRTTHEAKYLKPGS